MTKDEKLVQWLKIGLFITFGVAVIYFLISLKQPAPTYKTFPIYFVVNASGSVQGFLTKDGQLTFMFHDPNLAQQEINFWKVNGGMIVKENFLYQ